MLDIVNAGRRLLSFFYLHSSGWTTECCCQKIPRNFPDTKKAPSPPQGNWGPTRWKDSSQSHKNNWEQNWDINPGLLTLSPRGFAGHRLWIQLLLEGKDRVAKPWKCPTAKENRKVWLSWASLNDPGHSSGILRASVFVQVWPEMQLQAFSPMKGQKLPSILGWVNSQATDWWEHSFWDFPDGR